MLNKWQTHVVNAYGDVIPNATVALKNHGTETLADLFSDYDGTTPLANPTTASAGGYVECYLLDGRYDIYINDVKVWDDFQIFKVGRVVEAVTKAADYTLLEDDKGKILEMNITGAGTVTVPADSTFDFEVGTVFQVYNMSADPVTIAGEAGVTVRNACEVEQYKAARLRKRAADEWVLETSSGATTDVEAVEKTASYTLAEDDAGKILEMNITGAGTITVPTDVTFDFEIGTTFQVYNISADAVTVAGDTGVTVHNEGEIPQYGSATLRKRAANEWAMATTDAGDDGPINYMFASNLNPEYVYDNSVSGDGAHNVILFGEGSLIDATLDGDWNLIAGTWHQISGESYECCAIGGDYNYITDGVYETIVGGYDHFIESPAGNWYTAYNAILGGDGNIIRHGEWNYEAYGSVILAGDDNIIDDSSQAAILGGYKNKILSAHFSVILGGKYNLITQNAEFAVVAGEYGIARYPAQRVLSQGDDPGTTQISELVMGRVSGSATPTKLEFHGRSANDELVIPDEVRMLGFEITVSAMQIGGVGSENNPCAFWKIAGGFKNAGLQLAAGTIYFTGIPADGDTITIKDTTYTWRITPTLDTDIEIGDSITQCQWKLDGIVDGPTDNFSSISSYTTSDRNVFYASRNYPYEDPNSWTFTVSSGVLTADGDGTFGGTALGASGAVALIGTPSGLGTPDADKCDPAVAAQGTITMSGLPVADETFAIDGQTFTWKASRSAAGEVAIGATAAECVTSIVSAVSSDLSSVTAEDGVGDTVVVTADTAGPSGNSIVFTQSSTNMAVDGSGTLGGTTAGSNGASTWEVDVVAVDASKELAINVTGEADKDIRWTARIELTEVGN